VAETGNTLMRVPVGPSTCIRDAQHGPGVGARDRILLQYSLLVVRGD